MSTTIMADDIDKIADKVVERLSVTRFISPDEHWEDHQWARRKREQEDSLRSRRQQIIDKAVGTIGVAAVLGFLGWFGHAIISTLNDMLGRGGPP